MSLSFRKTYLGRCWKPYRGFDAGKLKEMARTARRKLANLFDEEGLPIMPKQHSCKLMMDWHRWTEPDERYRLFVRNGRWFLKKKNDEPE